MENLIYHFLSPNKFQFQTKRFPVNFEAAFVSALEIKSYLGYNYHNTPKLRLESFAFRYILQILEELKSKIFARIKIYAGPLRNFGGERGMRIAIGNS